MNGKPVAVIVALVLAEMALAAPSLQRWDVPVPSTAKAFRLKTGGKVMAHLFLQEGAQCRIGRSQETASVISNSTNGTLKVSGGVVLQLYEGTNSITITADELETVQNPLPVRRPALPAPLLAPVSPPLARPDVPPVQMIPPRSIPQPRPLRLPDGAGP